MELCTARVSSGAHREGNTRNGAAKGSVCPHCPALTLARGQELLRCRGTHWDGGRAGTDPTLHTESSSSTDTALGTHLAPTAVLNVLITEGGH